MLRCSLALILKCYTENVKTGRGDRPLRDVIVANAGELMVEPQETHTLAPPQIAFENLKV